ncbi:alpha/beta hydrolase family protein [Dethiosulfatarculus sandiegensis]|uniref:Dipeptidyl aminopeptidase n=1 Tax=Dethiosulfatarculus sandiegensis TaxID=1429043 RepID=A0A0D2J5W7_9BACT|nr:alpha/beta hydrolase [Dethiosulfatarculus sandiegensis]KIX11091.1 dipeptidyl aminopeptidase [Dethiosulfatarculus sandiegensis]
MKGQGQGKTDQLSEQKEIYGAHRPYVNVHFQDNDMDFALQWILGSTDNGGCEIGEAFYAASCMKEGDPQSWCEQWLNLAGRVEKTAQKSLEAGHATSARRAYFRAANYYRAILQAMDPLDGQYERTGLKMRQCFKTAARLLDPPLEYIEIPFEGKLLPGYFLRAAKAKGRQKTLIMIGGGETITEDLYFFIGPETQARGYNFLTVDIPGQGLLPAQGLFFRPDTEKPLKAVLDYALSRPEVDPKKLAMYGISGGGYYVPRAAAHDKRIQAIIMNSAVVDGYKLWNSMDFSRHPEQIAGWSPFKKATYGVTAWRYGLKPTQLKELARVNKGHTYDPAQITCPALVLIGEGEYANPEIKNQQNTFLQKASSPKKDFVVTPTNLGASSHCLSVNRSLMSQVVFDWLDETFSAD